MKFNQEDFIDIYTRAEAIADGYQVRCPDDIRREAGIRFPVFFTDNLWSNVITPSKKLDGYGQSLEGRLWDVLFMFTQSAKRISENVLFYKVIFLMPKDGKAPKQETMTLKAVIGPTDFNEPAPAITIMLPLDD